MENTKEELERYHEELETNHQDLLGIMGRMAKIQDDIYNKYFQNSIFIKLNYLEHLKVATQTISSKEEFKQWLENEMLRMKEKKEFTHIERVEYKFIQKIYKDVILEQGEVLDFNKEDEVFKIKYDDQEIEIDRIKFNEQ